jgi:predicted dehydrogenase
VTLRIALIGAGRIGRRRAATAAASSGSRLVMIADTDEARAMELATTYGCAFAREWEAAVAHPEVDAVVICTPNKFLSPITLAALSVKKHVLCEKPLGRNLAEATQMAEAARQQERILKVGFTLRFHPGLREAHRKCRAGEIGPLFYVRAAYGHGGRPGYAQEWRADPDLAGGGELLDQGVHLIDLARWFLGDFKEAQGLTGSWFWQIEPLEDNAFMLLRSLGGQIASLHTSWTEWRNRFRFEVFGRDGFVLVDGLGGSYGTETLTVGVRSKTSEPPVEQSQAFSGPDRSWDDDWADFIGSIASGRRPEADARDGVAVMRIVEELYKQPRLVGR